MRGPDVAVISFAYVRRDASRHHDDERRRRHRECQRAEAAIVGPEERIREELAH
jgi:hypothetical protein